jgi:hypothetical protein
MKLIEIPAPDFNLAITLDSGQVFHWQKSGNGFVGTIGDRAVYVEQQGDFLRAEVASAPGRVSEKRARDAGAMIAHYFALDHLLAEICASFPEDPVMNAAREFCRGLRIIRQPKWECLATFICSSMKQVAHIRQISLALIMWFTRFRRRNELRGLLRMLCASAPWAIGPKICSRLRDSSVQVNATWNHGRLCLIPIFEKSCAHCPAWEQR